VFVESYTVLIERITIKQSNHVSTVTNVANDDDKDAAKIIPNPWVLICAKWMTI